MIAAKSKLCNRSEEKETFEELNTLIGNMTLIKRLPSSISRLSDIMFRFFRKNPRNMSKNILSNKPDIVVTVRFSP